MYHFQYKKKFTLIIPNLQFCDFSKGLKNELETAVANEPSVFEPMKFYCIMLNFDRKIQSLLVISKSKEASETLRDIRTSTYQICRIEENTNRTTKFHK